MDNNQITIILRYVLISMIVILVILAIVYFKLLSKERKRKKEEEKIAQKENPDQNKNSKKDTVQSEIGSVLDFMEFENIEDNMIIKKKDKNI